MLQFLPLPPCKTGRYGTFHRLPPRAILTIHRRIRGLPFGPWSATFKAVPDRYSENQQVSCIVPEEFASLTGKILPGRPSASFFQVPVVAPAGLRSPAEIESSAVPPAWSPRTGFSLSGERIRIPRAVRTTGCGVVTTPHTCETKGSENVLAGVCRLRQAPAQIPSSETKGLHKGEWK